MGFGKEDTVVQRVLWAKYRDLFPVTERLTYLNHAAVAPLCRPARDAMRRLADDVHDFGSYHYNEWLDAYQGLRVAAARLINAQSTEIAITKNTSEGVATIANGIDWRQGDRVVSFEDEFPANYYPWERLASKGVKLELLKFTDPLDRIDEACRGARLLAISFVQYLSGFRADLNALGEICNRHNCFFFVDAIQGLGAFPLDVEASHIDALAADGHKWMLGPEGCGFLYVRKDRQDEIPPSEFGYTNVAATDYSVRDMTLRADASRYEPGTLNTIGIFGLQAAIEFLLDVGVERIAEEVTAAADQIAAGVAERECEILGTRTPENAAGIVSFRSPKLDSRVLYHRLKDEGIIVAQRSGWVRTSPHFYNGPEGIDRFLQALP